MSAAHASFLIIGFLSFGTACRDSSRSRLLAGHPTIAHYRTLGQTKSRQKGMHFSDSPLPAAGANSPACAISLLELAAWL
jgi:hypothetical protein